MPQTSNPCYFISACEPSGDLLAQDLVLALREVLPELTATGIAGPAMRDIGVRAVARAEDFAVMGFVEVLKHLPRLKALEVQILEQISRLQPQFAVLVDYPGFHMRLAEMIRAMGIPVIQYVAPQLWAWGAKRVVKLRAVTDLVLGIMPFEEAFFREHRVNYHYVGTPQVDRARQTQLTGHDFGLDAKVPVLGFFPGSRVSEVRRIGPKIRALRAALHAVDPILECAVSVAPTVPIEDFEFLLTDTQDAAAMHQALASQGWWRDAAARTTFVRGQSLKLMKRVHAALVTSGTATLECALIGTPMAVIYVTSPLTYQIAKRAVKLPAISLVNLVAGKPLVREFIQDFSIEEAMSHLRMLVTDQNLRQTQRDGFQILFQNLQGSPGSHGAQVIKDFLAHRKF